MSLCQISWKSVIWFRLFFIMALSESWNLRKKAHCLLEIISTFSSEEHSHIKTRRRLIQTTHKEILHSICENRVWVSVMYVTLWYSFKIKSWKSAQGGVISVKAEEPRSTDVLSDICTLLKTDWGFWFVFLVFFCCDTGASCWKFCSQSHSI